MGNEESRFPDFRTVSEAHEAIQIVLTENPCFSYEAQTKLRELRSDIYKALDGETNVRISIFVRDIDEPFKFKINEGKEHLIINILRDEVRYQFGTARYWTKFFKEIAKLIKLTVGPLIKAATPSLLQMLSDDV